MAATRPLGLETSRAVQLHRIFHKATADPLCQGTVRVRLVASPTPRSAQCEQRTGENERSTGADA